jgi:fructokinase
MSTYLWGIEVSQHWIDGMVISALREPKILSRVRLESHAVHGYDHVLSRIATAVKMLEAEVGSKPELIGIAIPGQVGPSSTVIKRCSLAYLNDRRLQDDIERQTKQKCLVANNATCFTLAESLYGAAVGASCTFGALIGEEVTGGVVFNGAAHFGAHGLAGAWGRSPMGLDTVPQTTINELISDAALCGYYLKKSGNHLSLNEIFKRYIVGSDTTAVDTINRLLVSFSQALVLIATTLDPDVIVIGGSTADIDQLFTQGVEYAAQLMDGDYMRTRVVRTHYDDTATVLGSALLTRQYVVG